MTISEEKNTDPSALMKSKRAMDLLKRAEQAFNKNNFGWASELYGELYAIDRKNNIEFLNKMILSSLSAKNMASNAQVFAIKAFINQFPYMIQVFKTKKTDENLEKLYELYEVMIRINPDSAQVLLALAKLYMTSDLKENAAAIYEAYARSHKKDFKIWKQIAGIYTECGNVDKARASYKKVLEIKPYDQEAEKKIRDLLAMTSIDSSKLKDKSASSEDSVKDKEYDKRVQIEMKVDKTIDELNYLIDFKLNEIEQEPEKLTLRYELLQYYKEKNDDQKVFETLDDICKLSPGDLNMLLERAEAMFKARELDYKDLSVEERDKKILLLKKETYSELAAQFPTNVAVKFKQGEILFQNKDNEEALKIFQSCSRAPEFSVSSLQYMGVIFQKKQMFDMAIDQYKAAIEQLTEMNDIKKDIVYMLGLAYEESGNTDKALLQYKEIYKEDVAYKDISSRIESSYKKND